MTRISVVWCKLRYFFIASFDTIPLTCACLATIDQYLITAEHIQFRQWSTIENAYRASLVIIVIWWFHGTRWLYYQDMSQITGACIYHTNAFFAYTILFIGVVICGIHVVIMMTLGILAYRSINKTGFLVHRHAGRQFTTIVFIQILLTLIGISPYDINSVYAIIMKNIQKYADRKAEEALVANIAYVFVSVNYA
ncbi:unnamed protein product, partial [Rotaria sp. Silwood2]